MLMVSDCQPCAERQAALLEWANGHTSLLMLIGLAVSAIVLLPHLTNH
jgi:hypothetical protein